MKNRSAFGSRLARVVTSAFLGTFAALYAPTTARAEFPTLDRAMQLARAKALVVADAQAELGVANAQLVGARVSAIGNPYSEIQIDRGTINENVQVISFNYFPVDMFGQRGARIDEAERFIEFRKLGLLDARAIAGGEIVSAYGELVVGAARMAEASAGAAIAAEEARYFSGRYEARDTTIYEKSIADAEVARWTQQRAEAELRVVASRARFAQLTGMSHVDTPAPTMPVTPPQTRTTWDEARVAAAVARSPLFNRTVAERQYWEASVDRYKTERLPPVSFELIGGRGDIGEARYGGGLVFTFPVTRRFQGEIARAESGRASAVTRGEIIHHLVETRLRAARDALKTVTTTVDDLDKTGIPALERAVAASVEGYKAGKIEITRLFLARRDLAIARARRLELIEAGWRAYADLTTLTGDLP